MFGSGVRVDQQPSWFLLGVSYPFIMTEGSSVSTQAAELTNRLSGGRAEFFPAAFLKTTVITEGHNSSNNNPHVVVQQPTAPPTHTHSHNTEVNLFTLVPSE